MGVAHENRSSHSSRKDCFEPSLTRCGKTDGEHKAAPAPTKRPRLVQDARNTSRVGVGPTCAMAESSSVCSTGKAPPLPVKVQQRYWARNHRNHRICSAGSRCARAGAKAGFANWCLVAGHLSSVVLAPESGSRGFRHPEAPQPAARRRAPSRRDRAISGRAYWVGAAALDVGRTRLRSSERWCRVGAGASESARAPRVPAVHPAQEDGEDKHRTCAGRDLARAGRGT